TTVLAPLLGRRLFHSAAARLLFVAVIALDPAAIDLAKEYKPYAVGLALHLGLLLTVLAYRDSRRTRDLVWVLVLAVPGILFALDAMFAYPGVFLVLAIDAAGRKNWRHLTAIAAGALVTMGLIATLYVLVWSKLDQPAEAVYWGKKYDVFFVPPKQGAGDQIGWLSTHYAHMVEMAGQRSAQWRSGRFKLQTVTNLKAAYDLVWLGLNLAGLGVIVRARLFREGLLLVTPIVAMLACNVLGRWPFGAFRTNLFVLIYVAGIAAMAVDRKMEKVRWGDLLPTLLLVLLPLVTFEKGWHRAKGASDTTMTSRFPEALKAAIDLQGQGYTGPREVLVTDKFGCATWDYYVNLHPTTSKTLGPDLTRRFYHRCSRWAPETLREVRAKLRNKDRVWVIATCPLVIEELDRNWPADLVKTKMARIDEDTHLVLAVATATAPAPTRVEPPEEAESPQDP
ncbi:MAG TPA: hypothetical protein VF395_04670, partial [Polyangiaceae bacterium]